MHEITLPNNCVKRDKKLNMISYITGYVLASQNVHDPLLNGQIWVEQRVVYEIMSSLV